MTEDFIIRPLKPSDAHALSRLLRSQTPAYVRFFTPFDFDEATLARLLAECDMDVWMGIYLRDEMAGFFMLRGWDAGYAAPAYGVLIDERYSGYGLTRLSLNFVKSLCRLRRSPRVMLKVHPENYAAKKLFEEARFKQTSVEAASGNLVYHFDLDERATKF
jgi:RimJ/RimL family protein N-acetyltransferase